MQTFWSLLKESVIMQGTLTLLVVGVWLYLVVTGQVVPEQLTNVVGLVVGFFFGAKLTQAQRANV
jgi:hypothetical protein